MNGNAFSRYAKKRMPADNPMSAGKGSLFFSMSGHIEGQETERAFVFNVEEKAQ